ncbi:MAG: transposase [bacterium]|nr:transposase [bacterium]
MGRQLRIQYENAFYHVISHGNGRQWIYKTEADLVLLKKTLIEVIDKYHVKVHAVVIMRNHYHMLIETPLANLSLAIKKMNCRFASLFNKSHGRQGSVFKDRYKAILIQKESYYLNVLRYICQNPVRLNLTKKCEDYQGSYLNWINDQEFIKYIYFDDLIEYFKSQSPWSERFFHWINDKFETNPVKNSDHPSLLGDTNWLNEIGKRIKIPITQEVVQKKKYIGLRFNNKLLHNALDEYPKKERYNILSYLYNKYSGQTQEHISKKLKIKNGNALRLKIYRFKKQLCNNPIRRFELTKLERIFFGYSPNDVRYRHLRC